MIKTYFFLDDSFYSSNGCSCCEPDFMECYNIDMEEHPDFPLGLGSAHSLEDCYEQVLIAEGILTDNQGWFSIRAMEELLVAAELRVVII